MPAENPMWRPPDGREILFRGESRDGFGLYASRLDGTDVRQIMGSSHTEFSALYFDWSPDGNQVAYQWDDGSGDYRIYVAPADGRTRRAVTSAGAIGPTWSPDGTKILFIGHDPDGSKRVSVVASDGSGRLIQGPPDTGLDLLWTPDGTKVLFRGQSTASFMLLDPETGSIEPAPWSLSFPSNPDWQRLAQ
jgi:TolB protein